MYKVTVALLATLAVAAALHIPNVHTGNQDNAHISKYSKFQLNLPQIGPTANNYVYHYLRYRLDAVRKDFRSKRLRLYQIRFV